MRKKILQLIVVLVAFCQMQVVAQTSKVTGKVVGPDNKPVAGASVTISGTNQGTVTDADGNFSITAPAGASLLVNSIGFTDQVVKVGSNSVINVSLASGQSAGLEEVIVTGYSSQKKKDILGSVAVVDVKALKAVPSGSALSALQGQAAGVNVINNGSPGTASQILVRGVTGFANAPLVLIDGIQGNINDVPATDVESIQVLKDAGAASIYGSRGSNGVVIVTTKRGKSGVPSIVYDSYYNLQVPRNLDKLGLLSAEDYARIYSEINPASTLFPGGNVPEYAYRGGANRGNVRGTAAAGDPAVNASLYNLDKLTANGANSYIIAKLNQSGNGSAYYDALTDAALMMQHNITLSGGSDRLNYLLSLGYLDQQGTVMNTFMKRYNVRMNSEYKVRQNIRIGENVNIHFRSNPGGTAPNGAFGPLQAAFSSPPVIPIYDIAGNFAGPFVGPPDELGDWGNAIAAATYNAKNRNRNYTVIGNLYAEIDFLKNFTIRTSLGGQTINYYTQTYTPRAYWGRNGAGNDELREFSGYESRLQWTNTLTYKNQFGLHNLTAFVGSESVENKGRQLYGRTDNFFLESDRYLILAAGANKTNPPANGENGRSVLDNGLFSIFGKVDYAFNDKYLVGFTIRRDGYSDFGSGRKYGWYPSVSAGWRISQEDFMQNVSWINDLKIRGSYGEMGNKEGVRSGDAYAQYTFDPRFTYYDLNGTNNSTIQGYYPMSYANPLLGWEKNKMLNVGFDATLFNNKFDFSIEYYKKRTDGLLRVLNLPATAGEGISPQVNIGDIENKGIDINANYRAHVSRDFNVSLGVNFTTYKNTIVDIPDPGFFDESPRRFEEGHPMGSFFGYKVVGVFKDQKDVDDHATQQDAAPGRWKYLDADGNGVINTEDRVHYGNPNPDFTLGINLGASYKNFDFTATLYSAVGQDVYNGTLEWLGSWERGVSQKSKVVLDAWSESNPNGTWKKNETLRNFSNSSEPNSAFLQKGSFIRLRNLQLGYNFANSGLKNLGINKVRVYVGGTNLFLITQYDGLDPEIYEGGIGLNGTDAGAYVQNPGVILGLNVNF